MAMNTAEAMMSTINGHGQGLDYIDRTVARDGFAPKAKPEGQDIQQTWRCQ